MKHQLDLQPGQQYQIYYNPGNVNNHRVHILRAIVDGLIVYRFWDRYKRRWRYEVQDPYYFELRYEHGRLKKV